MSKNSFFIFIMGAFLVSCQTYSPNQKDAEVQLQDQNGLLEKLEDQSEDIEDEYEDVKDNLTDLMQREGFLIRRLVRERKSYIKFSDQKEKLDKNIADQEARGVEEGAIKINREIGEYIQEVVDETKTYIDELEIELRQVTQDGLVVRNEFDKFAVRRQNLEIQISEVNKKIAELELILQ